MKFIRLEKKKELTSIIDTFSIYLNKLFY
jgi:hypothetical protein